MATKDLIQTNFHLRRERVDWSSGIVLTSRQGAERVIRNLEEFKLYEPIESQIFDGLKVYTDPIFTNDKEISSTLHSQDVGLYHEHSFQGIRDRLSAVPRKLKEISEKMSQYEVK